MPDASPKLQKRIDILTQAVAQGKPLKPEHQSEWDNYVKMGLAKPSGPKPIAPSQAADYTSLLDTIDKSAGQVSGWSTGTPGGVLGSFKGTGAYDLHSNLDTIKANLAFDKLQAMRENSPTGGALGSVSDTEGKLLASAVASLDPGQSGDQLKGNLAAFRQHYGGYLKSLGYEAGHAPQAPAVGMPNNGSQPAAAVSGGALPPAASPPANPSTPPETPPSTPTPGSGQPITLATGSTRNDVSDPTVAAMNQKIAGLVAAGKDASSIRSYLQSAGVDPSTVAGIDEAVAFRAKHPNYQGGYPVHMTGKDIPMSKTRQLLNTAAQSSGGAYAMGAGNAITAGYLDELTGNPALANAGKELVRQEHPVADLTGNATGGALAAYGVGRVGQAIGIGGKILAQVPAPVRAAIGDLAYGSLYGSGENNEDRVTGALLGGGLGVAGGVAGRAVLSGVGRAISPTGGALSGLYDNGVRPTLGQRFSNSGVLGSALNKAEEAYQSIPVVGSVVRGARQRARDQFERGAFDQALNEIGQKLPADMKLGTEPHAFTQQAFDRAYQKARGGMQFVPDRQYQVDRSAFERELTSGVLSDDQVRRVTNILDNAVTSRLQAGRGSLGGDAYKAAASDIGKAARKLSGSEPGISGALNDYAALMDNAARRSSNPDAVSLLDAADRGYSRLVRIEQAAASRGGDTGRFSPDQFDRSVQRASGGVRSKAYLRGDALMGDYAEAGKALSDRLPNSGSADRGLLGMGLTGAGAALSPKGVLLGALPAVPYLPGVRNATTALLAPRASTGAKTLGDLIRSRSALGGQVAAPLLIENYAGQ